MKAKTFMINKKSLLLFVILAILVSFELREGRSYADEILCGVAICYLLLLFVKNKINKSDLISIVLLVLVIFIGVVSNILSGLEVPKLSILIDIIAETKILWLFFAVKYYVDDNVRKGLIRLITPLAKIFFVSSFVCGVTSQFVDIGMTGDIRYGIKAFNFIFPMSFQFLSISLIMFAVLTLNSKVKHRHFYYILGSISLILATKSSPVLFGVIFCILLYYFKKNKVINVRTWIFLGTIILLLGTYQIRTYLMDENAPRYLFFYYGGVTANDYFPLGSGFATFGSDQAAREYSELYYQYGFNDLFGMNRDDASFLSDTFWAMAIGQFGWIGFAIYAWVYIRIFASIKKQRQFSTEQKAFVYAAYLQYIVHAVGSAILSSSAGVVGFIALAILFEPEDRIGETNTNLPCNIKGE